MGCGSPCSSWGGGGGGLRLAKPSAKTWRKGYPALFARFFAGGYGVWGVSPAPQNPLSGRYTLRMPLAWLTGGAGRGAKPLGGREAPPLGASPPRALVRGPTPPPHTPPDGTKRGCRGRPAPCLQTRAGRGRGPVRGRGGPPSFGAAFFWGGLLGLRGTGWAGPLSRVRGRGPAPPKGACPGQGGPPRRLVGPEAAPGLEGLEVAGG